MKIDVNTRILSSRKQFIIFFTIMILSSALSTTAYRFFNPQYVFYRDGQSNWSKGNLDDALDDFVHALNSGDLKNEMLLHISMIAFTARKDEIGYRGLKRLTERPRLTLAERDVAAGLYDANGHLELASLVLESAGPSILENLNAALHLASILSRLGRHEAAERLYLDLLALDPTNAAASLGLTSALAQAGRFEDAEARGRDALTLSGQRREARIVLARILTALGRFDEAIILYRAALEEQP